LAQPEQEVHLGGLLLLSACESLYGISTRSDDAPVAGSGGERFSGE
jgi:hypothetical protein